MSGKLLSFSPLQEDVKNNMSKKDAHVLKSEGQVTFH